MCKEILNCRIAKKISKELLEAHGVYDEIEEWFLTFMIAII